MEAGQLQVVVLRRERGRQFNMAACARASVFVRVHACVAHLCVRDWLCVFVSAHTCVSVGLHMHTHLHVPVCTHMCVCVCMCLSVYVSTCVCTSLHV